MKAKSKMKSGNTKSTSVNPKKTPAKMSSKQPASAKIPGTPKLKMGGSKRGC